MLTDGLEWCGLLVDYCDVFISCLDSHSDGTHSLQSIHCWASDAMLHFSKSDEETNSSTSWIRVRTFSANLHFRWTIHLSDKMSCKTKISVCYLLNCHQFDWCFWICDSSTTAWHDCHTSTRLQREICVDDTASVQRCSGFLKALRPIMHLVLIKGSWKA